MGGAHIARKGRDTCVDRLCTVRSLNMLALLGHQVFLAPPPNQFSSSLIVSPIARYIIAGISQREVPQMVDLRATHVSPQVGWIQLDYAVPDEKEHVPQPPGTIMLVGEPD